MGKSVSKAKARMVIWRVLKVAFYLLGFPLLYLAVRQDVGSLGGTVMGEGYAKWFVLAVWAIVVLVQIIAGLIGRRSDRKNLRRAQNGVSQKYFHRGLVVAIVALVLTAGPLVYLELTLKKELGAVYDEYKDTDIKVSTYEVQLKDYQSSASDLNSRIDAFCELYNIEYTSKVYGGTNADLSSYTYDPEDDAYYSANGMYADGYLFGYKQATEIMKTYYGLKLKYAAEEENIEQLVTQEIAKLKTNPNSEWNRYKKGLSDHYVSDPDEYSVAYNDEGTGTAQGQYVTEQRLDAIVAAIMKNFPKQALYELLKDNRAILEPILKLPSETYTQLLETIQSVDANTSLDDLLDIVNAILPTFGVDALTKADVLELLAGYSSYISPSTYPIFEFIEDEELRAFAYAQYYGLVHGAKMGSVLLSTEVYDDKGTFTGYSNVGEITLSASGTPGQAPETVLAGIEQIEADMSYMPKYYPYIALRTNLLYNMGLITFGIIAAYFCAQREKMALSDYVKAVNAGGEQ